MNEMRVNLPFEDYCKIEAVNFGTLKNMGISAKHYRYWRDVKKDDTPSTLLGRGTHTSVLEPDVFPLEYTVYRESKTKGKGAKINWQAFQDANQDKTILSLEEYNQCLAIRDAVRKHPKASQLLSDGQAETSMVWADPETGIQCKGRLDWLRPHILADLKTSRHILPRRFWRDAVDFQYHVQLAFYMDGLAVCTGLAERNIYMICVQSTAPHDVIVYPIADYILDAGRERYQEWLRAVKSCREKGEWPGYSDNYVEPEFPEWALPSTPEVELSVGGKKYAL